MALCTRARHGAGAARRGDAVWDPDRPAGPAREGGVCGPRPDRLRRRVVRVVPPPPGGAPRQRVVRGEATPAVTGRGRTYGTVGTWPAFSCASRAALSPASCVASSLGTNLPVEVLDEGLGDGDAAWAASVVAPYKTAPATPPTSIDPAMAAAATVLRTPFTCLPPCFDRSLRERRDLDWRRPLSAPCEEAGTWPRTRDPYRHELRRG